MKSPKIDTNKIAINHFTVNCECERHVNDFGNGIFIDLIRMLALYVSHSYCFSIQSI